MGATTTTINGTYRKVDYSVTTGNITSDRTFNRTFATNTTSYPERGRTRKPSGWLPPKGYNHYSNTVRYPFGQRWLYDSQGRLMSYWDGVLPGTTAFGPESDPLPITGYYERALQKCYALLKDERVNLAVALAEAPSTARTLGSGFSAVRRFCNKAGDNLSRVANAARAVKRGKPKEAARILRIGVPKKATSNWLSYQYGWLPLLSDIHGSAEALAAGPPKNFTKGCKAWFGDTDDQTLIKQTSIYSDIYRVKRRSGVFVRLDFEPSNTFLQSITSVGLTNPASVLWELVPFSFVVDWALPIGNYLENLDADLGWRFKAGSASTLRKVDATMRWNQSTDGRRHGNYRGSKRLVDFTRTVISEAPSVPLPRFKNPFSTQHAANGLSLLAEVAKKPPRL